MPLTPAEQTLTAMLQVLIETDKRAMRHPAAPGERAQTDGPAALPVRRNGFWDDAQYAGSGRKTNHAMVEPLSRSGFPGLREVKQRVNSSRERE
jgi:hypothetical protein